MREHLFKGFHPDKNGKTEITLNGEKIKGYWVEGNLVEQDEPEYHAYIISAFNAEVDENHTDILSCNIHEVLSEIVREYIDSTDKNGKKIFEGHIVKAKSSESGKEAIYLVCFDDTSLWFGFKSPNSGYIHSLDDLLQKELGDEIDFEIIGNIFENPELLK